MNKPFVNITKHIRFSTHTGGHWFRISRDNFHYGKAYASFSPIHSGMFFYQKDRLHDKLLTNPQQPVNFIHMIGPSFKKIKLARCFVQSTLIHFGRYDEDLINLKTENHVDRLVQAFNIRGKETFRSTSLPPSSMKDSGSFALKETTWNPFTFPRGGYLIALPTEPLLRLTVRNPVGKSLTLPMIV